MPKLAQPGVLKYLANTPNTLGAKGPKLGPRKAHLLVFLGQERPTNGPNQPGYACSMHIHLSQQHDTLKPKKMS